MRRESHVRFCEGGGVRLPSATRLARSIKFECLDRLVPLGERRFQRAINEFVDQARGSESCVPIRAPQANAVAERFVRVRTIRSRCLDWLLILNDRHLERTLRVHHRSLQRSPVPSGAGPDSAEARRGCDPSQRPRSRNAVSSVVIASVPWSLSPTWLL